MEVLQLATTIKAVSLKDLVIQMESGEEKLFPIKNDQSVRSLISSSVKFEYPEREYTTKRMSIENDRFLKVIRLK